jgi:hypothetical protein
MRASLVPAVLGLLVSSCGAPPPGTPEASPPATAALPPSAETTTTGARDGGARGGEMSGTTPAPARPATFAEDLAFLRQHGAPIVLEAEGGARVALSAEYQGRVMTSAVEPNGRSLGWIHRAFIESKKTGTPFDNHGGEDRFWLGPEGGQYGLYFAPGAKFEFDAWQTPHALQEGAWTVVDAKPARVTFKRSMAVTNWSKALFTIDVERMAQVLGREDARKLLGLAATPAGNVRFVAYETRNRITNAGKTPWKKESGLPSVWILAMFAPVPDTKVIVPFENGPATKGTPIVIDDYFGKVPAERLSIREKEGYLLFSCDGKLRSKIGLPPARAKSVLGSYSAEAKLLTIVHYDGPKPGAPYVNSKWEQQKAPYGGDVVNSYNDGPVGAGKPPLGPFYEIETSSPGAELGPGQSLVHTNRTFHFVGERAALEPIARKVLGVSLADIAALPPAPASE